MTESDPANDDSKSPSIDDYDDFYDLLGVSRSADEDEIMKRSRKLLGKYHPDVSDHPDADNLFKNINRAQSVLTNAEQRTIYNKIGHDQYVEKREEGGEMTLSESVTVTNDFDGDTSSGEGNTSDEDISTDIGSTGRNEQNTWAGKTSSHSDYESINELDMDLQPKEAMKQLYRQIWLLRLVFVFSLGTSLIYLWFENASALNGFWSTIGAPTTYGTGALMIVALTLTAVLTAVGTGVYSSYYMRSFEDDITLDDTGDDADNTSDKNDTRGVNTPGGSNQDSRTDSWDVNSRYDAVKESEEPDDSRHNQSLRYGSRSLLLSVGMLVFGVFVKGVHPWEYLEMILNGEGVNATLWWVLGGDSIRELAILLNAGGALVMFLFAIIGFVLTAHGLSREIWYRRYFTSLNVIPTVWDAGIIAAVTAFSSALVLNGVNIPNATLDAFPSFVVAYLAAGKGVTSLSVTVAALTSLYMMYLMFGLRGKLG
jgi:flagellar basal body-associated protein FliL